jgi:hypothetical protein
MSERREDHRYLMQRLVWQRRQGSDSRIDGRLLRWGQH